MTYERMSRSVPADHILVVTLSRYKDKVKEILPDLPEENILLEPYGRNTAPSVAFAAYELLRRDPEATILVSPADHVIPDLPLFDSTVELAFESACEDDGLYTIGVVPTRPDTNFGYIQVTGGNRAVASGGKAKAKSFMEKPDIELAKVFIESGEFLWNTGIFIWKASSIKSELEHHAPEITRLWEGWEEGLSADRRADFLEKVYADCPKISIDYAVMEKSDKVWIFPGIFRWADIGNWESLYSYLSRRDADGNAVGIIGPSIVKDNRDSFFYTTNSGKLTIIQGMSSFLVVDTDDVLMICPRDDKKIKEILSELAMPEYTKYK